jgi:8-amino-7-oxononanoate synthase
MKFSATKKLEDKLNKRKEQNALRLLVYNQASIDFCSNDYLGFARSEQLHENCLHKWKTLNASNKNGSGGSRLLAGNTLFAETLENKIAQFHQAQSGLIFNSGYDANTGLFSALMQKGDTILYDELIHASIHDGIKLSKADAFMFKHNDLLHLEERLKNAQGIKYVTVESIYSMDGDEAPLQKLVELCEKYNANLIVDEAHATGITHNDGKGLVQKHNLQEKVFARIHTFGKALGVHGAIVLGSNILRDYLINFARSFIYTTALPIKSLIAIDEAYQLLQLNSDVIQKLTKNIVLYNTVIEQQKHVQRIISNSPIQTIIIGGNENVKLLAKNLQSKDFDVRPILSPTVPKGKERLRICLHSFNTEPEIVALLEAIDKAINN